MKRFLPILCTLILLLGQTVPTFAMEDSSDPPSTAPSDSIPPIQPEPNGDIEDNVEENVEDNTETNEENNIEDNMEDSTPPVPETPQELPEITQIFNVGLLTKNIALNYGDTAELEDLKEELTSTFRFLAGLTADDEEAMLVVEQMELEHIDVFKPGTYPVTVILKLHESYVNEFTISDEIRTLHFNIYVAEKEGISLVFISSATNRIQYNILNSQKDLSLSLWYAVTEPGVTSDKISWQPCPTGELCIVNWDSIYIYRNQLITHQDYLFQLRGADVNSNIIRINLEELPDGSDGGYMGGDKDGNDNNDNSVTPPLTQIPPSPPISGGSSSNSNGNKKPTTPVTPPISDEEIVTESEITNTEIINENLIIIEDNDPPLSATPHITTSSKNDGRILSIPVIKTVSETDLQGYERVDGDTMTISGARLAWLLQRNTSFVPFGWNEVSLKLPTEVLSALSLSSDEMLSMTLTKESDLAFTITLTANGVQIQDLGQTIVQLPVPEPKNEYTLTLAGAPLATSVSFENGYAVFTVEQAGYYQLTEETGLESTQTQEQPLEDGATTLPSPKKRDFIPLVSAGILLLSGVAFLLRRKRP